MRTYDVLLHRGEVVGEVIDLGDVAVVLRRVVAVGHQREAEVAAAIVAAQLGDLLGDLQNVVLRAVGRIKSTRVVWGSCVVCVVCVVWVVRRYLLM